VTTPLQTLRRAATAAIALTACEGPFVFDTTRPPSVASVVLTPDSARLVIGDALAFLLSVRDSAGNPLTDRAVTWTSSAPAIASVGPTGVATAQAPGSALVIATVEGRADTAPLSVVPLLLFDVAAGGRHTCAAANTGVVYCWGSGAQGQLGVGFISLVEPLPLPTTGTGRYFAVGAGGNHSCALAQDSTAACWGRNASGQLGRDGGSPTGPAPVVGAWRFVGVGGGDGHTCALTADSIAYCWGENIEGQLGDSQGTSRADPAVVAGGRRFGRLAVGGLHTCALAAGGAAWCWGADQRGQLGDSAAGANRLYPVPVAGAYAFTAIAAGGTHSCGITATGVLCWGDNTRGQLGTGTADSLAIVPVPVAARFVATAVVAGGQHSCAVAADSTAHCWGANDRGQLGDDSRMDRPAPTAVVGGLRFVRLTAGADHTCGLTAGGVVHCWGAGTSGQLGVGGTVDIVRPLAVSLPTSGTIH
jgi:alpha-tubulin suppressor-like RCC1 family protein